MPLPINGCLNGLFVTALVAVLLVPAPYYVTNVYSNIEPSSPSGIQPQGEAEIIWLEQIITQFPPIDLFITSVLLSFGVSCYICEWIQRKLMERRITKLKTELVTSVERLQNWDAQQEQLEATLKMVQNATSEYNLLLYLLLRQHRCLQTPQPSNCYYDKDIDEDLNFLRHIEV